MIRTGVRCWCAAALACAALAAQPARKSVNSKPQKDPALATSGPSAGIKTPGVLIPFSSLKPEAEIAIAAEWIAFSDSPVAADQKSLFKIDAKKNDPGAAVASVDKPCGGAANGFASWWVPVCGDSALLRLDPKTWKTAAKIARAGAGKPAVAASADSVWFFSDGRTTLSRVDPEQNGIVAELRLDAGCTSLTFGETALWVTCPAENRVVRVNPSTNLAEKRIEVSAQPSALAIGENSVWVYCRKDGKVDRIDPKTNKVVKTVELGVAGEEGSIAVGQGSVWVSLPGYPLTRIDPQTEKVVQQFWGPGGGRVWVGQNSVWIGALPDGKLWRVDPKRAAATLAE